MNNFFSRHKRVFQSLKTNVWSNQSNFRILNRYPSFIKKILMPYIHAHAYGYYPYACACFVSVEFWLRPQYIHIYFCFMGLFMGYKEKRWIGGCGLNSEVISVNQRVNFLNCRISFCMFCASLENCHKLKRAYKKKYFWE